MKHNYIKAVEYKDILEINFDLAIFSCGYEKRSSYLITQGIKFQNAICFSFQNENSTQFYSNKNFYDEMFIKQVNQSANSNENILIFLSTYFENISKKDVSILVDYSSMSRIWYASILFFIKYLKKELNINLYLSYCVPKFEQVESYSDHIIYEPVEYISQITIPDKPTALVISLGDTERQAIGLKEYFDAEEVYCFYADSKYKDVILEKNKSLIKTLPSNRVIGFPLRNILSTNFILEGLCREVKEKYRIVIAPCGPKTFTLASFIVSNSLSDIDVWRISKPERKKEIKEANGDVICLKLEYDYAI